MRNPDLLWLRVHGRRSLQRWLDANADVNLLPLEPRALAQYVFGGLILLSLLVIYRSRQSPAASYQPVASLPENDWVLIDNVDGEEDVQLQSERSSSSQSEEEEASTGNTSWTEEKTAALEVSSVGHQS